MKPAAVRGHGGEGPWRGRIADAYRLLAALIPVAFSVAAALSPSRQSLREHLLVLAVVAAIVLML